jgi:hypothetical protein
MRPSSLLAVFTIPLLGLQAVMPPSVHAQARGAAQWQVKTVRRCARADTLFGRYWRSHASIVRVGYSPGRDTTTILTPDRNLAWEVGSSRLVKIESVIQIPGQLRPADSARIELSLSFVDSIFRSPEQAPLRIELGLPNHDSMRIEILEPQVEYVTVGRTRGVPVVVKVLLTPSQSLALAGAFWVRGSMGPFPFSLKDWEVWEINAVYRGSFCGFN